MRTSRLRKSFVFCSYEQVHVHTNILFDIVYGCAMLRVRFANEFCVEIFPFEPILSKARPGASTHGVQIISDIIDLGAQDWPSPLPNEARDRARCVQMMHVKPRWYYRAWNR